jgi:hypothetical protein
MNFGQLEVAKHPENFSKSGNKHTEPLELFIAKIHVIKSFQKPQISHKQTRNFIQISTTLCKQTNPHKLTVDQRAQLF